MKKFIFIITLVLMLALSSVVVFAQDEITVTIDSTKVEFNNDIGTPFIDQNYRTQVPFRVTLEKFGATVDWNPETRTAIATKGDTIVEALIGKNYILKNGEKIEIDTVAIIQNNRTYLPIRAIIEAFGSEVQWDKGLKTVVITSTPVDAKKVLMDAYTKSANWENYDGNISMNMAMQVPDENGGSQPMDMKMNMYMTAFTNPQKIKITSNMIMHFQGQDIAQPAMEMYVTIDKDKLNTYMGMYDATGKLSWTKSTIENAALSELANYDIKTNLEITEKYTKDVKYFGKYIDEKGRTLLRIQNTLSKEVYTELLGTYLDQLSASTNAQENITAEMLKNLGDFEFIMFIDETTNELVKYEMDLSSIYASMLSGISLDENMSAEDKEALSMLKGIKAIMIMDILNINQSKDFIIPKQALEATEALVTNN